MNKQRGASMIETLITLSITGILAGTGLPVLKGTVERHRIQSAAETFQTDLQLARLQTLKSSRSVQIAMEETAAGSCYVVFQGPELACRCSAQGLVECSPSATVVAQKTLPKALGISMAANVKSMTLGASFGTVTPTATISFQGSGEAHLKHVIAVTGRIRSCGSPGFGTPACKE